MLFIPRTAIPRSLAMGRTLVRRFGNHIVDFSLISNGGEMKAAHA
jgi:hypothetical protein